MDSADKDGRIGMPLLTLRGTRGAPPTDDRLAQVREQSCRRAAAADRRYLQEETPDGVCEYFVRSLTA